jgi:hypothetical protein
MHVVMCLLNVGKGGNDCVDVVTTWCALGYCLVLDRLCAAARAGKQPWLVGHEVH